MMIPLGMGAASPSDPGFFTPPADPSCVSSWSWIDPFCWGQSMATAATAGGVLSPELPGYNPPPPPSPPGAPAATADNPTPLTTPPSSGAAAAGTIDATIAAEAQANQQALLNFYQQQAALTPTCTETIFPALGICDSTVYWGLALAAGALFLAVKVR
jgi:hypothetical protein